MDIKSEVAAVEDRIKAAGLTVDQFCERAEIHRATWQRWKAGKTEPSVTDWFRAMSHVPASEPDSRPCDTEAPAP